MKTLTDQEIVFCNEYLKDFNAARAGRAAGYMRKGCHQLLRRKAIAQYIIERQTIISLKL